MHLRGLALLFIFGRLDIARQRMVARVPREHPGRAEEAEAEAEALLTVQVALVLWAGLVAKDSSFLLRSVVLRDLLVQEVSLDLLGLLVCKDPQV